MMINDRNYYLIWSYEHKAWWRGKNGYARDWLEAGFFTKDEATRICAEANRYSAQPEERMVRLDEVESFKP